MRYEIQAMDSTVVEMKQQMGSEEDIKALMVVMNEENKAGQWTACKVPVTQTGCYVVVSAG